MRELIAEILGWRGYLERGSIQLQLLLLAAVLLGLQLHWTRRWLRRWPRAVAPLLGSVATLLLSLALQNRSIPAGLLQFLGLSWLGWTLLDLLRMPFLRWLPEQRVQQLFSRIFRPLYLLLAILALINQLDSSRDLAVIGIGKLFGIALTIGNISTAVLVIYGLLVASGPPAAALAWLLHRLIGISDGSRKALEIILSYAVVGLGITAVCFQLGLNSTALLAIAGGLSVGLGFGIKEVFSNFISGIWLLFEGSVRPGEVLMLDGDSCEVRKLGLRATLLWRDRDNAELLIPNQTFFTEAATSYTASDRMRRSQVNVGAAYHHDPATVIALLEATALQVPLVLKQPAPKALLLSYGDFAINYALRFWIANPMDNVTICSDVNQAIWQTFQEHQIEIPFPQQVEYAMTWPPQAHEPNLEHPRPRS